MSVNDWLWWEKLVKQITLACHAKITWDSISLCHKFDL